MNKIVFIFLAISMAASVQAKSVSYTPIDSTRPLAEFPTETVVPHNPHNNPVPRTALDQDYDSTGSNDQQQNAMRYKNSGVVDENGDGLGKCRRSVPGFPDAC